MGRVYQPFDLVEIVHSHGSQEKHLLMKDWYVCHEQTQFQHRS